MPKEISCGFLWYKKIIAILKILSKGYVIFPILLLCISCTSYHVASHEGGTIKPMNDPKESTSSPSLQCKPQSEGLYVVQAGAFTNISNAQALRKNLEDKGYESYITVSGFDVDKRIFRVLVGKFPDRKQAQNLSEEMKKENLEVIVALKPPKDKFVVQAGCYLEMIPAKALRKKLADDGYNAYITLSGTGKDKRYNVLLGEFLDRAEAEQLSEEIKKKEDIQVFVNTI